MKRRIPFDDLTADQKAHRIARQAALTTLVTRVFILLVGTVVLGSLLVTAFLVGQVRSTQVDNTQLNGKRDLALERIKSCTTPDRPCYERGLRQTAAAVGDIKGVIVLAAACASGSERRSAAAIEACVLHRLGNRSKENP